MLYHFTNNVLVYQVKMLTFYNDQTTNVSFVDETMRYTVNSYSKFA